MMRASICLTVLALLAGPAAAENRTFVVASAPDGYGIDYCLATAARCGTPIADAYCQDRDFSRAASFKRVETPDTTASLASPMAAASPAAETWVAIECTR